MNQKEVIIGKDGITPVMHQHTLTCLKSSKQFKADETLKCFVAEMDGKRFAVWDAHWSHHNKYEVFTEQELHENFNET